MRKISVKMPKISVKTEKISAGSKNFVPPDLHCLFVFFLCLSPTSLLSTKKQNKNSICQHVGLL